MADDSSVRVAVRIRPQSAREVIDMCRTCTTVTAGEPQVILGADKAFTYDYVFDMDSGQVHIYNTCVRHLIEGCLQGYNATVLAYGQTGSGKTYSMGTGLEADQQFCSMSDNIGILPRSVYHLFSGIEMMREEAVQAGKTPPEFRVQAQFLELYNEEIIDLLEPTTRGQRTDMRIHEDQVGGIYVAGATSKSVATSDEAMHCLHMGALARTTASTQMNAQSSRSHAIFTLHIRQQRLAPAQNGNGDSDEGQANGSGSGDAGSELETLSAKLHFVDLAGSERLKRTGATGERAKEGISINCGLLALGNVISALGDAARKALHVPYRDSKLTRLLQDSLGGNSRTLMIACCSPSDRDFMETLNTLKYANRARNIKNRVVLNQDRSSRTIALLRQEILQLQQELAEYKQGKRVVSEDGHEAVNDMFHENRLLQAENQTMRTRLKALQETVNSVTIRNAELQAQKAASTWSKAGSDSDVTQMVQHYLMEIEELRARLCESENMACQLRRAASQTAKSPLKGGLSPRKMNSSVNVLIEEAKRNLEKDKSLLQKNQLRRQVSGGNDSAMEASVSSMEPSGMAGQSQPLSSGEASDDEEDNSPSSAETSHGEHSSSSSSDSEDEDGNQVDENGLYSAELAELTSEISVKQQLIEELELSQRRLDIMKHHYEEKLVQLQERIRATQEERDKVLAGFAQNHGPSNPNVENTLRRVREDYERKLSDMQSRLKKLQAAQQEHAKLVRSQSESERQLKSLKNDLLDMKRNKVKLMQKMKEEANRHKELEMKRTREIAQLRKESRKRENEIRTLQMDKRVKETVLKRKQEEVNALRKVQTRQGVLSERASGRVVAGRNSRKPRQPYSPKVAKQKWHRLEHNLSQMALNRLTVSQLEKDLERLMGNRDELSRSLSETLRIRDRALMRGKEESYIRELDDQLESLKANIDYVQENIAECQRNIVQIEETKEGQGDADIEVAIQPNDMEEARYLLAKLIGMTLNHATLAAQREASNKELQNQVKQVLERDAVHQQLLQHVLANSDLEVYNLLATGTASLSSAQEEQGVSSRSRSRSPSPAESVASGATTTTTTSRYSKKMSKKARRLTFAAPEDLLYYEGTCTTQQSGPPVLPPPIVETQLELPPPSITRSPKMEIRGGRGPAEMRDHLAVTPPLGLQSTSTSTLASPRLPRKSANHSNSNLLAKLNSSEPGETSPTPPASPPTYRRMTSREENPNVFSRLTHGTNVGQEPVPDRGVVNPYQGKLSNKSPLICTRTAEGHCQAVLSICATDANLFSASKDRTVKVWDLHSGVEIQSLDRHPNNVVAVKYSPETGLVFTASSAYVKVWDLRQSPSRCIKTLSSSGWPASGNQANTTSTRSLQLPQGETLINDIALSCQSSAVLYAAAGSQVRIWDIRKFSSTGKLSGGHQAAVMCLAVGNTPPGAVLDSNEKVEFVVTGSKDHYVKVFEVRDGATGVLSPRFNLDPPHYDGVQCLSLSGSSLVSGSRDACIKLWDVDQGEQVLSLSNAHRDWICGLVHLPQRLVISGCRGGVLRLWSTETWDSVGEMRAHSASVNAITFNSTNIFTASNDNTVNIWRLRSNVDSISPEAGESF